MVKFDEAKIVLSNTADMELPMELTIVIELTDAFAPLQRRFPSIEVGNLSYYSTASGLLVYLQCVRPAFLLECVSFPAATGNDLWRNDPFTRMATDKELSDFLEQVERRAFKQAVYAVRRDEAALDIVQDAMIKLAEKYGDKPAAELPMLFQRILQTTILDYFRREKVRNTWISLFSGLGRREGGDEDFDILDAYEAEEGTAAAESSMDQVERAQTLRLIEAEIQKLPARQREAFLMRYWQDMDVAETAAAMGCSEGSVKTHCSRATHTLADALRAKGIKL
jgi:RNA polymerase sigma factor (sigma-70 family)